MSVHATAKLPSYGLTSAMMDRDLTATLLGDMLGLLAYAVWLSLLKERCITRFGSTAHVFAKCLYNNHITKCGVPQVPSAEEKTGSALLLSRLMRQALHGPRVALFLSRLLPPGLITAIHVRPYITDGVFTCLSFRKHCLLCIDPKDIGFANWTTLQPA